jgi:hypothetical protein
LAGCAGFVLGELEAIVEVGVLLDAGVVDVVEVVAGVGAAAGDDEDEGEGEGEDTN